VLPLGKNLPGGLKMNQLTDAVKKSKKVAFTEKELEAMGICSAKTLKRHRYQGIGLPYVKIGPRRVRYLKADLLKYLKANRIEPAKK
jgi:hypothetical protein